MTNAFHEQLALLRELQEIDLNLHNYQLELNELPERIRDVRSAYAAVKEEFEATTAELKEMQKTKRTDESELEASTTHLREREAKLYAIKTNKEYQAAIKEISEGKRINREREDRILQAMERLEQLETKRAQLEKDFADKEAELTKAEEEIKADEAEIRKRMEEDTARRPSVVSKLDNAILRKYDFVRKRYAMATAPVMSGACQGCSTRLPPQLLNEMLRREELKACPSCQRIIYIEVEEPKANEESE